MNQLQIQKLADEGFLVSPSFPDINNEELEKFLEFLKEHNHEHNIITKEVFDSFKNNFKSLNENVEIIRKTSKFKREELGLEVVDSYDHENVKRTINDWVAYYNDRYNKLKDILLGRPELRNAVSIDRIKNINNEKVVLIGMIKSIRNTANNNLFIELEDPTGVVNVLLMNNKQGYEASGELVVDEIIGVLGSKSNDFVFANKIIFPDIPEKEIKKSDHEGFAVFTSDMHVGSKDFMPKVLERFINWLRQDIGDSKQKEIASKVKYLFIVGDLVDGVGIYPDQEKDLNITNIYDQYSKFAEYIEKIPSDIKIIVCPGNHDALRIAEPQPRLFEDIAKPVYDLPNVKVVSNPAVVNIHKQDGFPGYNVLMYHGYSFDYFVSNIPKLRQNGYERGNEIMEFLLKKRHLAVAHGATLISPMQKDYLVIKNAPDIFASGHIHYANVGRYKGVTNLCCSCFQKQTSFQEKMGHHPMPGKIPVLDLKDRSVRILNFN